MVFIEICSCVLFQKVKMLVYIRREQSVITKGKNVSILMNSFDDFAKT